MTKGRIERRLAVIMATDIVGSSRLMEADEGRTLEAIKRLHACIFCPIIDAHGGRIAKLMEDGALVAFNSAIDAVECAISLQKELAHDQKELPSDERIVLRIGINLADVVIEGDDLLGDGVNVAARLEASAEPGGICIADVVHRQLGGKCRTAFFDGGEILLKNIAKPAHVWRWKKAPVAAPSASFVPARTSIAVLPFENLCSSPDQSFFSDGITEDIIGGLARFRSLSVIAANSSFRFRGKNTPLREIGRKLGVTYLVEGSIRRSGERIRITAQLIEGASGTHLWSEHYDRDVTDIFAVQDDVRMIVSTLIGHIESADLRQVMRKPTTSLAAYEFYLRGLVHMRGYGADDNRQAREMFLAAVERDPQFALARAHLALATIALNGYANAPSPILDEALALARQAVALDEGESGCQRLLALIHVNRREFELAERHYRRAHQLNPNDTNTLVQMGGLLARRGKLQEAMEWIDEGYRLNPFPPWYSAALGNALYILGRYEDAAAALKELPNPGPFTCARLVACYAQAGNTNATETAKAQLLQICPDFSTEDFIRRGLLLERPEQLELFRQGLLKAGLPA
ncbi:TolB-like protein/class 3 adenylate cyclase/Tfp pilus assembly protein PilF [Sinorhizobium kostiense]|uniref:TolB-like protein/class 3 adenylate cyclase/Tfp pilus assembly protein PilF n=1 Tax=Sinorhizobium kostiense TaxID=76747 RepID=A0ABS4QWV4_9HYPH|nr:adenylate/guanylate cyclase domain-containing protein [Sinorhizobium kostiense]MBP2234480.1 TolB-like protein/class 3 adenylate cyclase/Tfp pilus assembly protein PilF [Sinorhizobium kostiense]